MDHKLRARTKKKRRPIRATVASAPAGLGHDPSPPPSAWKKRALKVLAPAGLPPADLGYSQGFLADARKLVVLAGNGPDDLAADMETQMHQTFRRIERVLREAGATFDHVIFIRSYFVHLARDLPVFRKVRRQYLSRPYPASTVVGVTALAVPGLDIEVEVMAVL